MHNLVPKSLSAAKLMDNGHSYVARQIAAGPFTLMPVSESGYLAHVFVPSKCLEIPAAPSVPEQV